VVPKAPQWLTTGVIISLKPVSELLLLLLLLPTIGICVVACRAQWQMTCMHLLHIACRITSVDAKQQ
jgi:hypothetical protein